MLCGFLQSPVLDNWKYCFLRTLMKWSLGLMGCSGLVGEGLFTSRYSRDVHPFGAARGRCPCSCVATTVVVARIEPEGSHHVQPFPPVHKKRSLKDLFYEMAEREGFEPSIGVTYTPLAGERLQPLGHLSEDRLLYRRNQIAQCEMWLAALEMEKWFCVQGGRDDSTPAIRVSLALRAARGLCPCSFPSPTVVDFGSNPR